MLSFYGLHMDELEWGEPLGWHKLFGHSFRISKPVEMR
jgi:hypothetical protein